MLLGLLLASELVVVLEGFPEAEADAEAGVEVDALFSLSFTKVSARELYS